MHPWKNPTLCSRYCFLSLQFKFYYWISQIIQKLHKIFLKAPYRSLLLQSFHFIIFMDKYTIKIFSWIKQLIYLFCWSWFLVSGLGSKIPGVALQVKRNWLLHGDKMSKWQDISDFRASFAKWKSKLYILSINVKYYITVILCKTFSIWNIWQTFHNFLEF